VDRRKRAVAFQRCAERVDALQPRREAVGIGDAMARQKF